MIINIESLDNKTLFTYIIIILIVLFIFSKLNIDLNLLYGTFIAIVILYYVNNHIQNKKINYEKLETNKSNMIKPTPTNSKKYTDIVNFLFSIQDFYIYNPQSYEILVKNLDIFFDCYEETSLNPAVSGERFNDMILYKRDALNALHSIIFMMPTNTNLTQKLNKSLQILEQILNKYLDIVKTKYQKYLYNNGYTIDTKILETHHLPMNLFQSNETTTYDFF